MKGRGKNAAPKAGVRAKAKAKQQPRRADVALEEPDDEPPTAAAQRRRLHRRDTEDKLDRVWRRKSIRAGRSM